MSEQEKANYIADLPILQTIPIPVTPTSPSSPISTPNDIENKNEIDCSDDDIAFELHTNQTIVNQAPSQQLFLNVIHRTFNIYRKILQLNLPAITIYNLSISSTKCASEKKTTIQIFCETDTIATFMQSLYDAKIK
jgi:hypothetical protein